MIPVLLAVAAAAFAVHCALTYIAAGFSPTARSVNGSGIRAR